MRKILIALALVAAGGCTKADNEPGPGGVTVGEARALDEAAEMIDDFLRAQMFFDGQREISAAFHRRIVGDEQAFLPVHAPDAGHHTGLTGHEAGVARLVGLKFVLSLGLFKLGLSGLPRRMSALPLGLADEALGQQVAAEVVV